MTTPTYIGRNERDERVTFIQGDRLLRPKFLGVANGVMRFGPLDAAECDRIHVPPDLLERFAKLGHPDSLIDADDFIEAFASEFGPLGLYELPGYPNAPIPRQVVSVPGGQGLHRPGGGHVELASWWHGYIVEFAVLYRLTGWVGNRAKPTIQWEEFDLLWSVIEETSFMGAHSALSAIDPNDWAEWKPHERYEPVRKLLMDRINLHLLSCGMHPALIRAGQTTDLETVYQDRVLSSNPGDGALSLFGALTLQLMQAALGEGGKRCRLCGDSFTPRRTRQEVYCSEACRKAGATKRTQRHRETKRAKKSQEAAVRR
jgi:hypothetical protein